MTTLELEGLAVDPPPGAPAADHVVAPASLEEAAAVLDFASEHQLAVLVWGGGTHQGYGARIRPAILLSTARLNRIVDYQPDDMTIVVQAGVTLDGLEDTIGKHRQSAVLPEHPGTATVGGVVAAGVSGWRRLRYGPTRDRLLEAVLVTGDGRIVKGGGRVVKNVTGYDLPRLVTGSLGSLGLVGQVALKLWPQPVATVQVAVADLEEALGIAYRPLAAIEENGAGRVFLAGTPEEVEAQTAALGGVGAEPVWPQPLPHSVRLIVRVPPAYTGRGVAQLDPAWAYQAAFGVGEVRVGMESLDTTAVADLRRWAEGVGGAVVVEHALDAAYADFDPWGRPPPSLELQRRLIARFDPVRVVNPGRMPGGI